MKETNKEKESVKIIPSLKPFVITSEEYEKSMEYFNSPEYKEIMKRNNQILEKVKNKIKITDETIETSI